MNKETPEAIDQIFIKAIDVYNEKADRNDSSSEINKNYGTNKSSCEMYFRNIVCMLKGERFPRSMSSTATEYLLKNFYSYKSGQFYKNSLLSLEKYIKYNEDNGKSVHKLRDILSKWSIK